MSKASKLGGGDSFQRASAVLVGNGLSDRGRAKAVAEGRIPSYSIIRIPLAQVSPTPLNPRRNFGTPEELTRFGEELRLAQLAACVVVGREAYLGLWPDHESQIGVAEYVLVNGERRFRSALQVELSALDFVVRDEFADSREVFLNKLLKENLDRSDFDLVERANGVQQLVEVCAEASGSEYGAQARAADQLGKSKAWVTNQVALLTLPAEVRASVSSGTTAGRDAVWMARRLKDSATPLTAAELFELLEAHKAGEAQLKAQKKAILSAATAGLLTAVNNPDSQTGGRPDVLPSKLLTAVNNLPDATEPPSPRAGTQTARQEAEGRQAEALTAVNTSDSQADGSRPDARPAEVLTAINTSANTARTPAVPHPVNETALSLRQHLGATPVEQADSIVRALTKDELVALVEELCNRV